MKLDYYQQKNSTIENYLHKLEVLKNVIDLLPQLPQIEENLRKKSLLKSSLYSARIEGNRLQLKDIQNEEKNVSKNTAKKEIFNILKALRWLYSTHAPKKLTINLILRFHRLTMSNLSPEAGHFRRDPSAIFNKWGVAIYISPPPFKLVPLLKELVRKVNVSKEPGPVRAAISHFTFEKIHPFLDGNGPVGRLISSFILKTGGYSFRGLISLEEFLENNRQSYYDLLSENKKDITRFVEFFLDGMCNQAEKIVDTIKNQKEELPEDRLLPRRQEILSIIKDHKVVSFDFIKRRFRQIPSSTLHYDIKKLIEGNFVKKLGATRGVFYSLGRDLLKS